MTIATPGAGVEAVAVGLAVAYVLLAIRESRWCWPAGVASSALYGWIFLASGLAMQSLLQLLYVALGAWGWWTWSRPAAETPLRRWPPVAHALFVLAVLVLAAANAALLRLLPGAVLPLADSLLAWGSVVATVLVARKVVESWLWWIVVDAACVALFVARGLWLTAALYLLYTAMAVAGWLAWRRRWREGLV